MDHRRVPAQEGGARVFHAGPGRGRRLLRRRRGDPPEAPLSEVHGTRGDRLPLHPGTGDRFAARGIRGGPGFRPRRRHPSELSPKRAGKQGGVQDPLQSQRLHHLGTRGARRDQPRRHPDGDRVLQRRREFLGRRNLGRRIPPASLRSFDEEARSPLLDGLRPGDRLPEGQHHGAPRRDPHRLLSGDGRERGRAVSEPGADRQVLQAGQVRRRRERAAGVDPLRGGSRCPVESGRQPLADLLRVRGIQRERRRHDPQRQRDLRERLVRRLGAPSNPGGGLRAGRRLLARRAGGNHRSLRGRRRGGGPGLQRGRSDAGGPLGMDRRSHGADRGGGPRALPPTVEAAPLPAIADVVGLEAADADPIPNALRRAAEPRRVVVVVDFVVVRGGIRAGTVTTDGCTHAHPRSGRACHDRDRKQKQKQHINDGTERNRSGFPVRGVAAGREPGFAHLLATYMLIHRHTFVFLSS
mmetsp:Transcript_8061/g.20062  ORF Transcript_8061/g.20062 Transcript_8061/m.20062 type:complete len:468 (+) Transcript_8061:1168-2571(+)